MTEKKKAEKATEPEAEFEEGKLTPLQWAKALGHYTKHGRGPEARKLLSAAYESANVLYGWSQQAHHWGADSLKLTEKDFCAAMDAAAKFPTVRLHAPAISQVFADKYRDFEPLKAHKD